MLNHINKSWKPKGLYQKVYRRRCFDMYNNWASDPEVTKYITWPTHTSIDVTKRVVSMWTSSYDNPEYYHWVIELKETGSAIKHKFNEY